MKKLVGSDIGAYTFNAATGQITLTGLPAVDLSNFLVITDVTGKVMLYNFADPLLGGAYSGGILSLDADTSALNNADILQIWVDLPGEQAVNTGLDQPLTNTQLRASNVPVTVSNPGLTNTELRASNVPVTVSNPGLTNTELRASAIAVSGTVAVSNPGLTDTQLRATAVPVSVSNPGLTDTQLRASAITVAVNNQPNQPLTDTQLRATAVPISGTVTVSNPGLTDAQLRASALNVTVSNPMTGYATDSTLLDLQDSLVGVVDELKCIGNAISYPPTVDRFQNRVRGTVVVESGTITTVTGLNYIDLYPGRNLVADGNFNAWHNSVGSRFL